ncbi:glycosyltransferase [Klebsiella pneumoniae]|uniref:glycosyltransferase n=1 Tax=Klebsiella pneumoniae TaxID=573 RepID=UPI000E3BEA42|nr:glycosyltransferase [Klebsiella pneumoniae]MDW1238074.1 glycosyltransferase [Klebsiella pneumoniae]MDZ0109037.1 glycosyltransferase [Klebsiella pneumoniae]UDD14193.1 glycosyltransferase [Klebsiella pneumoniae]HBR1250960.1 glycosyltransferase [Klebsiella pneumoniae]HBT1912690.1 glycosyltransferase family 4 protein [Klebsiella pneumoniae]
MRVGISRLSYPEKRCIANTSLYEVKNLEYINANRYISITNDKLLNRGPIYKFNPLFGDFMVDAYAVFNDVVVTKKKWVTIFETMVPRYQSIINFHRTSNEDYEGIAKSKAINEAIYRLADDNCLSINALSENAMRIQAKLLDTYPELKPGIMRKITVTKPPQAVRDFSSDINYKDFNNSLNLVFIGRDFYRKGGGELIVAINELLDEGFFTTFDINLTIVGDINRRVNYCIGQFNDRAAFFSHVDNIINKRENISVYKKLDNSIVMRKLSDSHIGFLPTWADTYGYSVLEMQSEGIPVITSNVRALSEINYSQLLINIPTNQFGEIVINSEKQVEYVSRLIIDGIKDNIKLLFEDRRLLAKLSRVVRKEIIKEHSPDDYFKRLLNTFISHE